MRARAGSQENGERAVLPFLRTVPVKHLLQHRGCQLASSEVSVAAMQTTHEACEISIGFDYTDLQLRTVAMSSDIEVVPNVTIHARVTRAISLLFRGCQ
jgi:hypothetical protein